MMKTIRSTLFIIVLFTKVFSSKGQNIAFEFGTTYLAQKAKSELHPDIRSPHNYNTTQNVWKINYEHFINNRFYILGSFCKYEMSTYFNFKIGNNASSGVGWPGTDITRLDFSLMYNVFSKSKFLLQPYAGLGIQKSKVRTAFSGDIFAQGLSSIRPDVRVLKDLESDAFSMAQVVPVVGLKFGYAFWNRLELFFDFQGVFGQRIVQEMRMVYSYQGVEQPEAINFSDGSGRFYTLGLGYRIVKPKVKRR